MKVSREIAIYHLGPVDLTDPAFVFADLSATRFEKDSIMYLNSKLGYVLST